MRPTRVRALLLTAVVAGVVGWVVGDRLYADLPPLPRYLPVTLALLAVVELGMARVVHDRVAGSARRGARPLHPLQVARAVALAKASSPTGALLGGLYAGLLVELLPASAVQARSDAYVCAVSVVAGLLLVIAALALERACRTPDPDPDRSTGLGSRA